MNEDNKIVGIGYNGMPIGCSDDILPWGRDSDNILETKQLYGKILRQYDWNLIGIRQKSNGKKRVSVTLKDEITCAQYCQ